MEVRVINSAEQFLSIRADWDALLLSAEAASVFMSWEWNHHWWKHYGRNQSLRIITVWEDEQLKAVLPLYLQRTTIYGFRVLTSARFIGTGGDTSPDYLGPILEPTMASQAIPLLVGYLLNNQPDWQVLRLSDLDRNSAFFAELEQQCAAMHLPCTTAVSARIAFVALPPTWDDYLATVHRDRRNTIRRTRRKVESQHQGRFYVVSSEAEVDDILASLIALHHRRWQGNPNGHAFSTPEYVGFHGDVVRACARRDWIRFYCLEADGKRIAVFYCYRFRNQIFYFQAGFDPDYERLRPGLVLIGHALEHAIEEGNFIFDFLRGEHPYKTQWGKSRRETHTMVAYRPGLRAMLYRLQSEQIPAMKLRLKSAFPFLGNKPHATVGDVADRQDA